VDALTDYIRFCTAAVKGGSLVLFTSYTDMRAVATVLEPEWRVVADRIAQWADGLVKA